MYMIRMGPLIFPQICSCQSLFHLSYGHSILLVVQTGNPGITLDYSFLIPNL